MEDPQLLAYALIGNEAAWNELLQRYQSLIYGCIVKVARRNLIQFTEQQRAEIYSDVCFNLLRNNMRKLRAFSPQRGTKLSSWIGMVAVNSTYDYLRTHFREPEQDPVELHSEHPDASANALDVILAQEQKQHFAQLQNNLPPREQQFLQLYLNEELPPEAIASTMQISLKTVYSKKAKIWHRLEALAEEYRFNDRQAA